MDSSAGKPATCGKPGADCGYHRKGGRMGKARKSARSRVRSLNFFARGAGRTFHCIDPKRLDRGLCGFQIPGALDHRGTVSPTTKMCPRCETLRTSRTSSLAAATDKSSQETKAPTEAVLAKSPGVPRSFAHLAPAEPAATLPRQRRPRRARIVPEVLKGITSQEFSLRSSLRRPDPPPDTETAKRTRLRQLAAAEAMEKLPPGVDGSWRRTVNGGRLLCRGRR
jgi:hypothetical protein